MADITMPKMGFDMTEGTLVRWLKKIGDQVQKGESIAEIETDKVTIEIEAFASGKLTKIVAEEGASVPVGDVIAVLDGNEAVGESTAAPADSGQAAASQQAADKGGEVSSTVAAQTTAAEATPSADSSKAEEADKGPEAAPEQETKDAASETVNGEHTPASPVAKRLARENNLDIRQIQGSGPGGRIVKRDIEQAISTGAAAAPATQPATTAPQAAPQPAAATAPAEPQPGVRREPLSRTRQTIARRLVQSKGPVPHFYVTSEIDMEAAMALRKQLNATGDVKITVNDIIVKAAALAIRKYPVLNASFAENALDYHDYVHVSIAVATDNGLLAPAVTDVDKKSIGTISAEAKELIGRAREGKVTPDELQRGTFSVSNMGMYPVDSFVAIINPPQAMILAIGAVTQQPVVRDGQIVIGQIMKATVSVDHRVSDGVVGAEYLQELKRLLENPMLILL